MTAFASKVWIDSAIKTLFENKKKKLSELSIYELADLQGAVWDFAQARNAALKNPATAQEAHALLLGHLNEKTRTNECSRIIQSFCVSPSDIPLAPPGAVSARNPSQLSLIS